MKLYQLPFSSNCQKVVALAHEVGPPLELASVELLWESTAMLPCIAAKGTRADLAPTTARERADVYRWAAWQGRGAA